MNRATAGLVFAALAALAGCEKNEPTPSPAAPAPRTTPPPPTTPTTPTTSPSTTPSTRDPQKDVRDQQGSTWRRQLDDAKTRVDSLRTKAANAPDSTKMELTGAVHELDNQVDKIQGRMGECKDAVSANWEACKSDIETMFTRLNQQILEVTEKFNQPAPASPGSPNEPEKNPSTPPSTPPDNPGPGPG